MSVDHYRNMCQKHRGKHVRIQTRDGRVHEGIIQHVDQRRVYLRPMNRPVRNYGGFGYPGYSYGYGWGWGGFGIGLALGAIVGIAVAPFFFW
ncbi:hypothetical protein J2S13_000459 [Oikeobacillus pervagus]|uniref:Uncharacterized protein n=1 Tax=Oikeobacillus pervagus TaxID=1325931 RepID=A0AAJ1SWT4_9BACI|nr:hypothetical protein [Oikeobacillus pervagus]MDQ0214064.1 hypothetical protein [Oikeobacillus pervagus]